MEAPQMRQVPFVFLWSAFLATGLVLMNRVPGAPTQLLIILIGFGIFGIVSSVILAIENTCKK
jgi:hypothetical protein